MATMQVIKKNPKLVLSSTLDRNQKIEIEPKIISSKDLEIIKKEVQRRSGLGGFDCDYNESLISIEVREYDETEIDSLRLPESDHQNYNLSNSYVYNNQYISSPDVFSDFVYKILFYYNSELEKYISVWEKSISY